MRKKGRQRKRGEVRSVGVETHEGVYKRMETRKTEYEVFNK